MTVTSQLLELFRVDKQLRGLRSRLETAERFLNTQQRQLDELEQRAAAIGGQLRHVKASWKNDEGEGARLDAKIATLREQMNSASTAKEYNAFLSELSNLKEAKTVSEEKVLESMGKAEALEKEQAEIGGLKTERAKIVKGAKADRDTKESEIRDRLEELRTQRAHLATSIPPEVLATFEQLVRTRGDEAMAAVEVVDRRNYEYSCGSCMMTLPMETVNSIARGQLTRCVSCGCVLYTEELDLASKKPAGKDKQAAKARG